MSPDIAESPQTLPKVPRESRMHIAPSCKPLTSSNYLWEEWGLIIHLDNWFSNSSMYQNHPNCLLKDGLWAQPKFLVLGWCYHSRFMYSRFEKHWFPGLKPIHFYSLELEIGFSSSKACGFKVEDSSPYIICGLFENKKWGVLLEKQSMNSSTVHSQADLANGP